MDFVGITNEALLAHGVRLPLEGQAVVSAETRFDKGLALQKSIFGERIDQMHKNAPENQKQYPALSLRQLLRRLPRHAVDWT